MFRKERIFTVEILIQGAKMTETDHDIMLWGRICRDRDMTAFRELFDRHYLPLCRFAEYWLRDAGAAEEVVLDLFTHLWEHADELHITSSLRAYLFRSVRNRALNRLRDDRFAYIPFEELKTLLYCPESRQLEFDEIMQLTIEAIDRLPERCREVFIKSRTEELSNHEIADRMHISVKTVEAQITKALKQLRKALSDT